MKKKKNFIIVRFFGGIGNQLFIYAMGKSISKKLGYPLKLDIFSGFVNDSYEYSYNLERFNLKAQIASNYESYLTFLGRYRRRFYIILSKYFNLFFTYHLREREKKFYPINLNKLKGKNVYIQGYWQSEMYFKDVEVELRNEFKIKDFSCNQSYNFLRDIKNKNSVAIHIRSYSEVPAGIRVPKLDKQYYERAINHIVKKIKEPHFFIFTDNFEYAKSLFDLKLQHTFIDLPNKNDFNTALDELCLISKCNHQIIANSTFSWWGAWLNLNNDKLVIAPDFYWNNLDIIPKDWIKI